MNLQLEDQHILIAGGLGGIGIKTVELLLAEGALVTILTQSSEKSVIDKLRHKNLNIKTTNYENKVALFREIKNAHEKKVLSGLSFPNDFIFSSRNLGCSAYISEYIILFIFSKGFM